MVEMLADIDATLGAARKATVFVDATDYGESDESAPGEGVEDES